MVVNQVERALCGLQKFVFRNISQQNEREMHQTGPAVIEKEGQFAFVSGDGFTVYVVQLVRVNGNERLVVVFQGVHRFGAMPVRVET